MSGNLDLLIIACQFLFIVGYWHSGSIFPFQTGIILNLKFLDKVLTKKDLSEEVVLKKKTNDFSEVRSVWNIYLPGDKKTWRGWDTELGLFQATGSLLGLSRSNFCFKEHLAGMFIGHLS